ncbi:MAG: hypothetical protein ACE14P_06985 [Methanotrichaceae archaeon]
MQEIRRGILQWFRTWIGNNEKFNCLYGAPTLIIVSGDEKVPMPLDADCAAATENLLIHQVISSENSSSHCPWRYRELCYI